MITRKEVMYALDRAARTALTVAAVLVLLTIFGPDV